MKNHIAISGLPEQGAFAEWKRNVLAGKKSVEKPMSGNAEKPEALKASGKIFKDSLLLMYREIYDYALDICRRTGKFFRNYRFGLGDRLRDESLQALEMVQLVVQGVSELDCLDLQRLFIRARIELRILLDLKQLSNDQWIYVNKKIERILELLRLGSRDQTITEENRSEFNSPLAIDNV